MTGSLPTDCVVMPWFVSNQGGHVRSLKYENIDAALADLSGKGFVHVVEVGIEDSIVDFDGLPDDMRLWTSIFEDTRVFYLFSEVTDAVAFRLLI